MAIDTVHQLLWPCQHHMSTVSIRRLWLHEMSLDFPDSRTCGCLSAPTEASRSLGSPRCLSERQFVWIRNAIHLRRGQVQVTYEKLLSTLGLGSLMRTRDFCYVFIGNIDELDWHNAMLFQSAVCGNFIPVFDSRKHISENPIFPSRKSKWNIWAPNFSWNNFWLNFTL